MMSKNTLSWIGAIFVLTAYGLNLAGAVDSKHVGYLLLNIFGAAFVTVGALSKGDYQPAVMNIVWSLVALVTLVTIFL